MSPSTILIPVDGSPASLRALDLAIKMATQNPGTSLVLLNVQNIRAIELAGASEAGDSDWLREAGSRASAKALKDATGKCEHADVAFETLIRTGQIAEVIAQVAREEDIKHIVMGTRGLGGIQGLLLGSVATQVLAHCGVPVLLVR